MHREADGHAEQAGRQPDDAELERILPVDCQPEIRVVWEPPWHPSMMSEKCRLRLGWQEDGAA